MKKRGTILNLMTIREIRGTFGRFFAIFAIIAIGVGFFSGVRITTPVLVNTMDAFLKEHRFFDYRILSTLGFEEADVEALRQEKDAAAAEGGWQYDAIMENKDGDTFVYKIYSITENINQLRITEGRMPESAGECLIDSNNRMSLALGDTVFLTDANDEDTRSAIRADQFKVVGFADSSLYINFERGTSSIGNGTVNGFLYLPKEAFTEEYYTEVYVCLDSEEQIFSDAYKEKMDENRDRWEDAAQEAADMRYDRLYADAEQELSDAKEEFADKKAEGEAELKDAEEELADGKKELDDAAEKLADGKKELDDAEKELTDGKKELDDAENQLADARSRLNDAKKELDSGRKTLDSSSKELADGKKQLDSSGKQLADAKSQLDQSEKELAAGKAKLEETARQLEDGEKQLDASESQLADAKSQLDQSEKELAAGKAQLDANAETLAAGKAQLDETDAQLKAAKTSLEENETALKEAKQELDTAKSQLDGLEQYAAQIAAQLEDESLPAEQRASLEAAYQAVQAQLAQGKAQYEAGKAQYEQGMQQYEAGLAQYNEGKARYDAGLAEYEQGKQQYEAALAQYNEGKAQYDAGKKAYEDGKAQYDAARAEWEAGKAQYEQGAAEYEAGRKQYETGKAQYASGKKQYDDAYAKYQDGKKQLEKGEADYRKGLAQYQSGRADYEQGVRDYEKGKKEYEDGLKEFEDAKKEYEDGVREYEDGLREYQDGLKEYEDGKKTFDEEIADAEQKIADAQKELADFEEPDTYLLERNTNIGYACFESDSEIVRQIAKVFPVFFILVAVLVCMTTMTRMVDEQRGQIGVLKGLGYSEGAIAGIFMFYSGLAAVLGCIFGYSIGIFLFPGVIWTVYQIMYVHLNLNWVYDWKLALTVMLVSVLCSAGTTYFSLRSELKEPAASLLRPRAPKPGKRIFLEYIPFIWNRMRFMHKISARNIFRYKKRFFMMVIGISGCTALLLTGFGIKDSIASFAETQFGNILTADADIAFKNGRGEDLPQDAAEELKALGAEYLTYESGSWDLLAGSKVKSVSLVAPVNMEELDSYFRMRTTKGEPLTMPSDGEALVSISLSQRYNVKTGDRIRLRNEDMQTIDVTVTGIFENHVYNYIFVTPGTIAKATGESSVNGAYVNFPEGTDVYEAQASIVSCENVTAVTLYKELMVRLTKMMASLDYIVVVIIASAAALALVVLYNLTNINILERIREIATIKVLGFYRMETADYVFRENMVLTLFGVIAGLGLGMALHSFVMDQIKVDIVYFNTTIRPLSFLWSVLLTFAFTLLVNQLMSLRIEKINMAESLKSVE